VGRLDTRHPCVIARVPQYSQRTYVTATVSGYRQLLSLSGFASEAVQELQPRLGHSSNLKVPKTCV